jgi:hypothetical protein
MLGPNRWLVERSSGRRSPPQVISVRFPESWSSTSLAKKRCQKHRQDTFVLDTAFTLIEGHPRFRNGKRSKQTPEGWGTRRDRIGSLPSVPELSEHKSRSVSTKRAMASAKNPRRFRIYDVAELYMTSVGQTGSLSSKRNAPLPKRPTIVLECRKSLILKNCG